MGGFAHYYNPVGGYVRLVAPGVAVHGCPFSIFGVPIGGHATAFKLNAPGDPILVANPTPYGPETERFLDLVAAGGQRPNVKYIVALDAKHHMALKDWKEQFPDAKIVGVDGLPEKKAGQVKFDYVFTKTASTIEALGLPVEIAETFDTAFFPSKDNELALFHKPSKTMVVADLLVNMPGRAQYADYVQQCSAWNPWLVWYNVSSYLLSYLSIESGVSISAARKLVGDPAPQPATAKLVQWPVERIIPCHGDVYEGAHVRATLKKVYGPLVKKDI